MTLLATSDATYGDLHAALHRTWTACPCHHRYEFRRQKDAVPCKWTKRAAVRRLPLCASLPLPLKSASEGWPWPGGRLVQPPPRPRAALKAPSSCAAQTCKVDTWARMGATLALGEVFEYVNDLEACTHVTLEVSASLLCSAPRQLRGERHARQGRPCAEAARAAAGWLRPAQRLAGCEAAGALAGWLSGSTPCLVRCPIHAACVACRSRRGSG